jgi:peptide/nickel transport system substrate-binding protein
MQSEKAIREKGHEWLQENPLGTGPYKLVKWSKRQEHMLVRNEDYWGTKPAFKYVRVRIIPEQATQIAELISGGVDVIKAVPPDQMDVINKSGIARTSTSPILRTGFIQLDQAGRSGKNPFQDRRVRLAANLAVDVDSIIKHVILGLGDRTATIINPMAFGYDPSIKPYRQDLAQARKLLAEAGYPNGFEVGFLRTQPVVEPGLVQTSDALVADLAKVGIRTKSRMVGEVGPFTNLIRDNKADPMFEFSWGYASVFDADAILFDCMTCNQPYSYYCNQALDDLVIQGRSTLDTKRRMELYARAQKLIHEDAAYIYKWGLRGVWGISNRIEYEAPRDEIDRMFVVTARKK